MFGLSSTVEETLTLVLFLMIIILWIRWRRKKLKIFEELRIPGPPPHFVFGNILEINRKGLLQCQEEWVKKYGQIVGYYHGLKPVLMISDKDILKRIFIKDFHLFSERPEIVPLRVHSCLDYIIPATQIMDSLLLNQKGENWKRVRTKLSPVFSANKLKMMIPFVDKLSEITLSILEDQAAQEKVTDVYYLLQGLTLDVINAQAFAIHTNVQREGEENALFRSAKTILDISINSKLMIFGLSFPELSILWMTINFLKMFFVNGFSIPPLKITNIVGKVIEQRRKYPEMRKPDILQSLIDASSEATNLHESKVKDDSDPARNIADTYQNENVLKPRGRLTDNEIKANALVVFLAGFETTSSSIAYFIHLLAKYPEYQAKIQREIDEILDNKELDYYIINNLSLLEKFMMESLRFYPPAINSIFRVASEDVDYGCLHIPNGMEITVPVSYMHFNEDNWENPEVFHPERFFLEKRSTNHVMNYWAFGIGPRNCLGMRLANITAKVILTRLLQRFSFELPDNPSEATISLNVKFATMVPHKVLVKVKKRECYRRRKDVA